MGTARRMAESGLTAAIVLHAVNQSPFKSS